jgi:DNA-binding transcriptional LysR family regulator
MSELAELETFVAAAQSGSFAAAARRLGLTPALVGRRIQALEDRHGARLIERTTRAQRLTTLGQSFLAKAEQIVEAMDELSDLTRPKTSLSGRIRLTAPTTLGITRLAAIIAEFTRDHPAVTVELNLSDRRADLIGGGYDLAVRIGDLPSSSLVARRVGTYDFVCCASPAYLEKAGAPATPDDLKSARCVLNLNLVPRNLWPFAKGDDQTALVEVSGVIELDNGEAMRAAALAGAGIIYAPVLLVAKELADGTLVSVLEDWPKIRMPIHTLHPSRDFVPRRVSALIDAIARGFEPLRS